MTRVLVTFCILMAGVLAVASAREAPNFRGETTTGDRVSLKESLKPGRALLVCFWATWCTPCMEELRTVSQKLRADPSLPLDVLAINVDTAETSSDVKPTVRMMGFPFPVVLDPRHEIFSRYQDAKTLPYSVLVTPTGEIAQVFNGYDDKMIEKARLAVKATNAIP